MTRSCLLQGDHAHGFLTLSLLPFLTAKIPAQVPAAYEGTVMGVNYGLDTSFPESVKVNAKVRAHRELMEVTQVAPNTLQLKNKITIRSMGEQARLRSRVPDPGDLRLGVIA